METAAKVLKAEQATSMNWLKLRGKCSWETKHAWYRDHACGKIWQLDRHRWLVQGALNVHEDAWVVLLSCWWRIKLPAVNLKQLPYKWTQKSMWKRAENFLERRDVKIPSRFQSDSLFLLYFGKSFYGWIEKVINWLKHKLLGCKLLTIVLKPI